MKDELVRMLTSLAGVALFAAAGFGLSELLPALRRRRLPERLGFSYLLGVAYAGTASFVASHAFGLLLRRRVVLPLVLVPLVAGIAAGILRRRGERPSRAPAGTPARRDLLLRASVVVGSVASLAILAEALTNPVRDWDGRMTWMTQAKYMRAAWSVRPAALTQERWYVTHPQYPPLLPLAQVVVEEVFSAPDDERVPRPLYAAFLPAYLLVLFGSARRLAGRRAAAAVTVAAALLPFLVFENHGGAGGCYSDFPLAAFTGAGLFLLLTPEGGLSAGLGGGLLLAGAALSKNEGFPLAAAALAGAALYGIRRSLVRKERRRRLRRLLAPAVSAALLVGLALALVHSWRAGIPNRFDERYDVLFRNEVSLVEGGRHLGAALPLVLKKTFRLSEWGIFWGVVPIVLLAGRRALGHPAVLPLLLAIATPVVIGLGAYALHWDPVYLADVTWSRFLLHLSMPLLLLLAPALRVVLPATPSPGSGREA